MLVVKKPISLSHGYRRNCIQQAATPLKKLTRRVKISTRVLSDEERGPQNASPPNAAPTDQADGPWRGDLSFDEVKEQYLRPVYLPASFILGTLTFGLKTAADNFVLAEDPLSFIGCAVVSGCLTMAIAWVLFDFVDTPPSSGNFSSPE